MVRHQGIRLDVDRGVEVTYNRAHEVGLPVGIRLTPGRLQQECRKVEMCTRCGRCSLYPIYSTYMGEDGHV